MKEDLRLKDYKKHVLRHSVSLNYEVAGVYFLIRNEEIVYIGSSSNCGKRIETHKRNGKMLFDRYYIHPIWENNYKDERDEFERKCIRYYRPKFNITNNPDFLYGTKALWFIYLYCFSSMGEVAELADVPMYRVKQVLDGNNSDLVSAGRITYEILKRRPEHIPLSENLKCFYEKYIEPENQSKESA